MSPRDPEPPTGPDPESERLAEVNREPRVMGGGADDVPKTTYVGPRASTDPNASEPRFAPISPGRGLGAFGWVAVVLVLLVLVAYLAGIFA